VEIEAARRPKRPKKPKKKAKPEAAEPSLPRPAKPRPAPAPLATTTGNTARQAAIEKALRAWRLSEAKRQGVPAFRIFTDRALEAIAATQPQTTAALLELPGVGLTIVEKYGARIFRIIERPEAG
jgi:DNA topoisomerase-3